jgi:hypothetical protein
MGPIFNVIFGLVAIQARLFCPTDRGFMSHLRRGDEKSDKDILSKKSERGRKGGMELLRTSLSHGPAMQ